MLIITLGANGGRCRKIFRISLGTAIQDHNEVIIIILIALATLCAKFLQANHAFFRYLLHHFLRHLIPDLALLQELLDLGAQNLRLDLILAVEPQLGRILVDATL